MFKNQIEAGVNPKVKNFLFLKEIDIPRVSPIIIVRRIIIFNK